MAEDAAHDTTIDWGSASVDGGRLTVALAGSASAEWKKRVQQVIQRLERGSGGWGEIKVTKSELRVDAVKPGSETDLRHLLESAVLQANADLRPEEPAATANDEDRSEEDQQMTDAFRSFSADGR
jgi:hypothetical protein